MTNPVPSIHHIIPKASIQFAANRAAVKTQTEASLSEGSAQDKPGQVAPSALNYQANFLTLASRRPAGSALTFGSNGVRFGQDIKTGYEDVPTAELWKAMARYAKEHPDEAKHFAFTPPCIAQELIQAADIQPDDRVLEPSTGTGSLLLPAALLSKNVEGIESVAIMRELLKRREVHYDFEKVDPTLWAELKAKNPDYDLLPNSDFLTMVSRPIYDKIIMSPPHAGAEIDHITKAWTLLKPGGTLVALLPAYSVRSEVSNKYLREASVRNRDGQLRTSPEYRDFKDWFTKNHGEYIGDHSGSGRPGDSNYRMAPLISYEIDDEGHVKPIVKEIRVALVKITKPAIPVQSRLSAKIAEVEKATYPADDNVVPIAPPVRREAVAV